MTIERFVSYARKRIMPLLFLASSMGLSAQADTSKGSGNIIYQNQNTQAPIENLPITIEAITMQDTLIPFFGRDTTDANGMISYNLISGINRHIGLFEEYKELTKVFPVPGSGINFQLPTELSDNYTLSIINMAGQKILQKGFNGHQTYVNLGEQELGTYAYNITNKSGENTISGKIIINPELPAQGEAQLGQDNKSNSFKTTSVDADYKFTWNGPGFVNGSQILQVDSGFNATQYINVTPWGEAFGTGFTIARDKLRTFIQIPNVPLAFEAASMNQIIVPGQTTFTTGAAGNIQYQIPVAVDTTGAATSGTAIYKISWPQMFDTTLDSNSVNITQIGYQAGDTLVAINDVNNSTKNLLLQPILAPELVGNKGLEFIVGKQKSGAPGSITAPADSVEIKITNLTTAQTTTMYADAQGHAATPATFAADGDQLEIDIGYNYSNSADQNGVHYTFVENETRTIQGNTLATIAAGDTMSTYVTNLIAKDSLFSGKDGNMHPLNLPELQQLVEHGQIQEALTGQINTYMDTTTYFGPLALQASNRFDTVRLNLLNWVGIDIHRSLTPYANTGAYDPNTFGTNIISGTNSSSGIVNGNTNGFATVQYVINQEIDGTDDGLYKEMGQLLGLGGVSTSAWMDFNGGTPDNEDCALVRQLAIFYRNALTQPSNKYTIPLIKHTTNTSF